MPESGAKLLRNVVLLSHSGAGKTSVAEAMLYTAKVITRLGRVDEGNTVSDYEPEEARRQSSIQTALLPCSWGEAKLTILDTPGYADFVGEVISGLRVADAAVLVVAAPSGVEVGTEQAWQFLQERRLPCIIFVNKMDREHADFHGTLEQVRQRFGKHCVALNIPIGAEQAYGGVIDLLAPAQDVPEEVRAAGEAERERLMEAIAETDDALATRYLEGQELTREELISALKEAVLARSLVPVLAGSAIQNSGIAELMDAAVQYLPSPLEAGEVEATSAASGDSVKLPCRADGPLVALVFKTTADPFVGKLSYFRVYSGTFKSNGEVWNASKGQAERVGQLFIPRGKAQEQVQELAAGEIGAVPKLTSTTTGDTLGTRENAFTLEGLSFPQSLYTVAVNAKSKADLDKMSTVLARLAEEDPSLQMGREPGTGEVLVSGMGDTHVEVLAEKAKRKFGVDLELSPPRVAYKETITAPAKVEYKHKKQTGGHGQYGHVFLELEPQPRGTGFEFGSKVVGGSVPKEYIPPVQKGVVKAMSEGVLAGFPLVDLKVTLYDGSSHPVDSSGMSFEIAGTHALRKGTLLANPVLLEPVMKLQVIVPDTYTGDIIGDLNAKRARIQGMTPQDGTTAIEAEAPQAEVLRYATELRQLTQGRGTFTIEFSHYEEVPQHSAQRIIEEAKQKEAARA